MSEWGLVAFYYDYKKPQFYYMDNTDIEWYKTPGSSEVKAPLAPVRGLVSRAYKYPGAWEMALHAYNGVKYFWERRDHAKISFDLKQEYDDPREHYEELNTAFDVFFEMEQIRTGEDSVRRVMESDRLSAPYVVDENLTEEEKTGEIIKQNLFGCEGSDGWLFIKYTEDGDGEPRLKYGYFYSGSVMDLRAAVKKDFTYRQVEYDETEEPFQSVFGFFDENATLMSEDEFWAMEDLGLSCIEASRKREDSAVYARWWNEGAETIGYTYYGEIMNDNLALAVEAFTKKFDETTCTITYETGDRKKRGGLSPRERYFLNKIVIPKEAFLEALPVEKGQYGMIRVTRGEQEVAKLCIARMRDDDRRYAEFYYRYEMRDIDDADLIALFEKRPPDEEGDFE